VYSQPLSGITGTAESMPLIGGLDEGAFAAAIESFVLQNRLSMKIKD
jgi:hypothetical protein